MSLDHLVILAEDLETSASRYEELGFTVMSGGEHADGLTRNSLIPFADGTYLELVAFTDPKDTHDNIWGWRTLASSGGGLVDHCLNSGDLDADVQRLREVGFEVDGPEEGGRTLPDGSEIRWSSAKVRQSGRVLPFLIQDLTPRASRVPTVANHPNGVSGISELGIAAEASEIKAYAVVMQHAEDASNMRIGLPSVSFELEPPPRVRLGPMSVGLRVGGIERALNLTHFSGVPPQLR